MLDTTAKLSEQGLRAGELTGFAGREADQRPRSCSGYRAAHGALDEAGIAGRQRRADLPVSARAHGAHIDEKTSFHAAAQQPGGAEIDALDRCVVEKEGNHDFRIVHQLAERRRPSRSSIAGVARVVDGAIPNPDFMANLEQPPR